MFNRLDGSADRRICSILVGVAIIEYHVMDIQWYIIRTNYCIWIWPHVVTSLEWFSQRWFKHCLTSLNPNDNGSPSGGRGVLSGLWVTDRLFKKSSDDIADVGRKRVWPTKNDKICFYPCVNKDGKGRSHFLMPGFCKRFCQWSLVVSTESIPVDLQHFGCTFGTRWHSTLVYSSPGEAKLLLPQLQDRFNSWLCWYTYIIKYIYIYMILLYILRWYNFHLHTHTHMMTMRWHYL